MTIILFGRSTHWVVVIFRNFLLRLWMGHFTWETILHLTTNLHCFSWATSCSSNLWKPLRPARTLCNGQSLVSGGQSRNTQSCTSTSASDGVTNPLGDWQPVWHFMRWHFRKELEQINKGCTAFVSMGTQLKQVSEMRLRKVTGRAISVLIGSNISQKKGLFPPLLFLLYCHQLQTIYSQFRSFSL